MFHLAVIRPAQITLAQMFSTSAHVERLQTYLFAGLHGPVTGDNVSAILGKHTEQYLDVSIGLQDYRQLASALSRWNRRADAGSISDHPFEHQRGHSTATYNAHYGLSTDMLPNVNPLSIVMDLAASTEWHFDLGLGPRYHAQGYDLIPSLDDRSEGQGERVSQALGEDMAATISQYLSASLPAAVSAKLKPTIDRGLQDILGYAATANPSSSTVTITPSSVSQYRTSMQSLIALRRFLGDEQASFTNALQGQALETILARKTNVLVVLPTGSGKSTLIFLPAKMFEQAYTTVVVVPLKALHEDFKLRATQHDIGYMQWTPGALFEACCVPLVFVSVEHAALPEFVHFLSQLLSAGLLRRVVWDEAHLFLVHSSFRECLNHMTSARSVAVPFVFLSATVAPSLETPMLDKLNVRDVVVFRLPSVRPEISTNVLTFSSRSKMDEDLLLRFQMLSSQSRGIIFCRSVSNVQRVARLLNIPAFYAALDTDVKIGILQGLRSGKHRAVVATSSLGEGVDIRGITYVWHYGLPFDPASYVQQSGRMCRDKSFGLSIVYTLQDEELSVPEHDFLGVRVINSWKKEELCRRIRVSEFLDGQAVECSSLTKPNLCDVCTTQAKRTLVFPPALASYPEPLAARITTSWEFPTNVDADSMPCDIMLDAVHIDRYVANHPSFLCIALTNAPSVCEAHFLRRDRRAPRLFRPGCRHQRRLQMYMRKLPR